MKSLCCVAFAAAAAAAAPLSPASILPKGKRSIIGVPFTAFDSAQQIAPGVVKQQYDYCVKQGMNVLLLMGTTGEWPVLSVEERMTMAEAWVAARKNSSAGSVPLMINVGHASIVESQRLARHAVSIGADSLLVTPPGLPYHAPTLDLLVSGLKEVLSAAPSTPAFYYHYEDLYGDTIAIADLFRAAQKELPTLVGAKFAGSLISLVDMEQATAVDEDRFATFTTADKLGEILSQTPSPRGVIAIPYEGRLIRSILDGNSSAAFSGSFLKLMKWRGIAGKYNVPSAMSNYQITGAKAVSEIAGIPVGPCRLPLPSVTAAQRAQLEQDLRAADLMPPMA